MIGLNHGFPCFGDNSQVIKYSDMDKMFVGSMDRASSQQLQMCFSEHFLAPKLSVLFVRPIVSDTVGQIWREKMSEKPHSIQLLR